MESKLPTPEQLGLPWEVHGSGLDTSICRPAEVPNACTPLFEATHFEPADRAESDAAFIVHATANFHPMLAALEELKRALTGTREVPDKLLCRLDAVISNARKSP